MTYISEFIYLIHTTENITKTIGGGQRGKYVRIIILWKINLKILNTLQLNKEPTYITIIIITITVLKNSWSHMVTENKSEKLIENTPERNCLQFVDCTLDAAKQIEELQDRTIMNLQKYYRSYENRQ